MKISRFINELKRRNRFLFYIGLFHFLLVPVFVLVYFFDKGLILGIDPWIKPIKFAISIGVYIWTYAWLLYYIQSSKWFVRIISFVIGISMFVEMAAIVLQSYRGVPSHFNIETAFDGSVFGIMGLMIVANSIAIFLTFIWFLVKKPDLEFSYLLSIRLAMIVFIFANLIGGMMIGNSAHSIGGADGGEGLPLVNWSTKFGDLRIAHFFGLHAIQIIPLFAFYAKKAFNLSSKRNALLVILFVIVFSLLFFGIYALAIAGKPLLNI